LAGNRRSPDEQRAEVDEMSVATVVKHVMAKID
jgi:hypothetical protein